MDENVKWIKGTWSNNVYFIYNSTDEYLEVLSIPVPENPNTFKTKIYSLNNFRPYIPTEAEKQDVENWMLQQMKQ